MFPLTHVPSGFCVHAAFPVDTDANSRFIAGVPSSFPIGFPFVSVAGFPFKSVILNFVFASGAPLSPVFVSLNIGLFSMLNVMLVLFDVCVFITSSPSSIVICNTPLASFSALNLTGLVSVTYPSVATISSNVYSPVMYFPVTYWYIPSNVAIPFSFVVA